MAGGSAGPENPTDQQCSHCYLYFTPQGLAGHEPNCNFRDVDVDAIVAGRESTATPEEGGAAAATPDGGAQAPPEPPSPEPQDTDEDEDDLEVDDVDEDLDPDCPECGHPDWWPTEDIAEVLTEEQVEKYDYCCADCRELYNP